MGFLFLAFYRMIMTEDEDGMDEKDFPQSKIMSDNFLKTMTYLTMD